MTYGLEGAMAKKRLIVCCDGTWNFADQDSKTNVIKVARAIPKKADGVEQRVYYSPGVGTRRWESLRGGAFGMGLSSNVMDAYRFLIDAYEPGDELYLFGFSRGAFTARSLAGLIRNAGILRQENAHRIKDAWRLYHDRNEKPNGTASELFRGTYAYETGVHFIGVWDTVGSLGIPVPSPRWLRPRTRQGSTSSGCGTRSAASASPFRAPAGSGPSRTRSTGGGRSTTPS
jgi:uncharacterized protein (DUF2235 family)